MKLITAKFPSRCATCGGNIEAGASIWFDGDAPKGNKTHHEACRAIPKPEAKSGPKPAPPAPAQAAPAECKALAGVTQTLAAKHPGKNAFVHEHFDDLAAFMSPRPMMPVNFKAATEQFSRQKATGWYGLPNANAVVDAIHDGWPDGAKRMLDSLGRVNRTIEVQSIRRVLCRDDHGDEFDIHRCYSGGFDRAWTRRKRGPRRTTSGIAVVLNSTANGGVQAEALFWRGAVALCLTDLLSEAGYSVQMIVGMSTMACDEETYSVNYQYTVNVKTAEQQLDIEALAAATALTGFFRVGGFRKILEQPFAVACGLGYAGSLKLRKLDLENPIHVPDGIFGLEAAQSWLAKTVAELTGEAVPA